METPTTISTLPLTGPDYVGIKMRQQQTWGSGDDHVIASLVAPVSERLCEAIGLRAGERVLEEVAWVETRATRPLNGIAFTTTFPTPLWPQTGDVNRDGASCGQGARGEATHAFWLCAQRAAWRRCSHEAVDDRDPEAGTLCDGGCFFQARWRGVPHDRRACPRLAVQPGGVMEVRDRVMRGGSTSP